MSSYTKETYSEICEFLGLIGTKYTSKIPPKLLELFEANKSERYVPHINPHIPIKEQGIKEDTLTIIALLNLKYWCKEEKEKQRLKKVYIQNEKEYQKILEEKYDSSNIFQSKERINNKKTTNMLMRIETIPFHKKIWIKIKYFFKK